MLEILVIAVCLLANAILACIEMAFVTVSKPRLREMVRTGNTDARRVLALRDNPERTLSVIQIGITLVGALAAAIGGAGVEESLTPILQNRFGFSEGAADALGVSLIVVLLTYLNVVMGELVPKTIALRNPLRIVLKYIRWLILLENVLSPIVTVFEWSTRNFLHIFFRKRKQEQAASIVTVELDQLSQQTRQYVINLVNVEKKRVKDVAVPWTEVISVAKNLTNDEVENVILTSGHTRIPVLDEERVLGVLNTKEFMAWKKTKEGHWSTLIREPVRTQELDPILKAFKLMQEHRSHLSIVYGHGAKTGIVTMEDVLEEIIGDIYDEDDDGVVRRVLNASTQLKLMRK
ncbi:MAG: hemolysin family protein [Bdellovibrionia bacterium]